MSQAGDVQVVLSCATSLDGHIDDTSKERLVLSSELDLEHVDELRASCDAILVGAGTIRADDPALLVRSEQRRAARRDTGRSANPVKVTLTETGDLGPEARFFTTGDGEKLVYCDARVRSELARRLGELATVIAVGKDAVDPVILLRDLASRGVTRLLIEGGARINSLFLGRGLVDELRLAIAPILVADPAAPRLLHPGVSFREIPAPLRLVGAEVLDGVAVLKYELGRSEHERQREGQKENQPMSNRERDTELLSAAIELSRRCIPSPGAFSVGALILDRNGDVIADGFSRESDEWTHAEEIALHKVRESGTSVDGGTVYSSLEPCSVRLSGKVPCTRRIIEAGVARVVFAMYEPSTFVDCRGTEELREVGVEVCVLEDLASHVAAVNQHLALEDQDQ